MSTVTKFINKRMLAAVALALASALCGLMPVSSALALSGAETQFLSHPFALRYVALGDSVATGLGLAAAPSATTEDMACGRSPQAYKSQVANAINQKLHEFGLHMSDKNAACQGAVVDNLSMPQVVGPLTARPQLD